MTFRSLPKSVIMFYNQRISLENDALYISNDSHFHSNHRMANLGISALFLTYGIILMLDWDVINQAELFIAAAMITFGVVTLIKEAFYKTYQAVIPLHQIKKIRWQKPILFQNRLNVRVWLKTGRFADIFITMDDFDILNQLKEDLREKEEVF